MASGTAKRNQTMSARDALAAIEAVFFMLTLDVYKYVRTKICVTPFARMDVGAISAMVFVDVVSAIKKRETATVDGSARMGPAIFLFTRSAIRDRTAMNAPPTTNDAISRMMKMVFIFLSTQLKRGGL